MRGEGRSVISSTVVATKASSCTKDAECGTSKLCNLDGVCQTCGVTCATGQCADGLICKAYGNGCAACGP